MKLQPSDGNGAMPLTEHLAAKEFEAHVKRRINTHVLDRDIPEATARHNLQVYTIDFDITLSRLLMLKDPELAAKTKIIARHLTRANETLNARQQQRPPQK